MHRSIIQSRNRLFALCIALLLSAPNSYAAPSTADAKSELDKTLTALKSSNAKQASIAKERTALEEELIAVQKTLVTLAKKIKESETELDALEEKETQLKAEKKQKQSQYLKGKKQLSAHLLAMARLSEMPPEAALAMPKELKDTLKTAQILKVTTNTLREEADILKIKLEELDTLTTRLKENREALEQKTKALKSRQEEQKQEVNKRQALQKSLYQQEQEASKRIADLSKKSNSLNELVQDLETNRARIAPRRTPTTTNQEIETASLDTSFTVHSANIRPFERAKGKIKLPATGKITIDFGQKKAKNETSKGITVQTRAGAQVTSPYDGEVVFTGPFLGYGKMVIIRHSDRYHTLLAGMTQIDCAPGQFLLEGEPIGVMGKDRKNQDLYIELRKQSKPVDISPWLVASQRRQRG